MAAHTVRRYCAAEEAALADAGRAPAIDWRKFQSRGVRSPIAAAESELRSKLPEQFGKRSPTQRADILQRWFVRYYTGTAEQLLEGTFLADRDSLHRLNDAPRNTSDPACKLSVAQREECRQWLIERRWQDDCKKPRMRRYSGLGDAHDKQHRLGRTGDLQAALDAHRLLVLRKTSKARTWRALTQSITRHFDLRWRKEVTHEERTPGPHQVHAERYLQQRAVE